MKIAKGKELVIMTKDQMQDAGFSSSDMRKMKCYAGRCYVADSNYDTYFGGGICASDKITDHYIWFSTNFLDRSELVL